MIKQNIAQFATPMFSRVFFEDRRIVHTRIGPFESTLKKFDTKIVRNLQKSSSGSKKYTPSLTHN